MNHCDYYNKITIFRLRLHNIMNFKFHTICFWNIFTQCHLVSDAQSFVIVCLETWQKTRGNGSCDTGNSFMSFQLLYGRLHFHLRSTSMFGVFFVSYFISWGGALYFFVDSDCLGFPVSCPVILSTMFWHS